MELKKKGQFATHDPKSAWERIRELMLDNEDLTIEELDQELKEYGIDPENTVRRVFEMARRISTDSHSGGKVSPLVSDILTQLAGNYYRLEDPKDEAVVKRLVPRQKSNGARRKVRAAQVSYATVQSFGSNCKEESKTDPPGPKQSEGRLKENADRPKRKKLAKKK